MDSEPIRKSNLQRICLVLGLGLPPILLLWAMLRFAVDFPYWDDWSYLYGTITFMDQGWDWSWVFARQGSHVNASTKLVFYAAYKFANADLKFCILLNYLFTWMVFAGMVLLLRRSLPAGGWGWVFYPLATFFSFSLCQWPVFFSAWGSCWLLLPVFLRAGMLLVETRMSFVWLTLCLAFFAAAASMTLAAGFAMWAAFPFYLWMCGRLPSRPLKVEHWAGLAIWLVGSALCFAVLSNTADANTSHEATTNFLARGEDPQFLMLMWCLENPHRALAFGLTLLGASATYLTTAIPALSSVTASLGMFNGALSLTLFALTMRQVFRRERDPALMNRLAPWLTIAVVELVMAGLVTVGRAGGAHIDRAMSPHYGMIGLQFQFAAYVGAYLVWHDRRSMPIAVMPARCLAFSMVFMIAAQLVGQFPLWDMVKKNAREKQFARDATYFLRALPTDSWPAPMRIVRMHRAEEYAQHGAMSLATLPQIEALLAQAVDSPELAADPKCSSFQKRHIPEFNITGYFVADLKDDSPTLLIELKGPDGSSVLLPARTSAGPRPGEFHCDESMEIWRFKDHRIWAVYAFQRRQASLLRVYRAPPVTDQ